MMQRSTRRVGRRGLAVWRAPAVLVVALACLAGLLPAASTAAALKGLPDVTGTKTVSGTFTPGSTVTYTVTLTNGGGAAQPDNPGHEFVDTLPTSVSLVSASTASGTAVANIGSNTVTWDGTIPAGSSRASRTILITVVLTPPGCLTFSHQGDASLAGIVSNQGTISFDADANGTNETNRVTDDPGTATPNDPTRFAIVPLAAAVTATKTANGSLTPGGTLTYSVILNNFGICTQGDNPGDEFSDTLPPTLTLVSASATSGTTSTAGNTASWNGAIPGGGSVTITITSTISFGAAGQTISNQGTIFYDADGDGTNEATGVTDNPATPQTGDPTSVVIAGIPIPGIPTLAEVGLAFLALALAGAALLLLRHRQLA